MYRETAELTWCLQAEWNEWRRRVEKNGGKQSGRSRRQRHLYLDRGGSVLAVAHLDSVQRPGHVRITEDAVYSPVVDNRVGAWTAAFELPRRGVVCDLLLTDLEETCASTAAYFAPNKQYHWMFAFDRRGEDVVLYDYETEQAERALADAGFQIGFGSYSDIVELRQLGVVGFNFGCGMQAYHDPNAWVDRRVLNRQIEKFLKFYRHNSTTRMPYRPTDTNPPDEYCAGCGRAQNERSTAAVWDGAPLCRSCAHDATTWPKRVTAYPFGEAWNQERTQDENTI